MNTRSNPPHKQHLGQKAPQQPANSCPGWHLRPPQMRLGTLADGGRELGHTNCPNPAAKQTPPKKTDAALSGRRYKQTSRNLGFQTVTPYSGNQTWSPQYMANINGAPEWLRSGNPRGWAVQVHVVAIVYKHPSANVERRITPGSNIVPNLIWINCVQKLTVTCRY